jgi:hypothetical protein
LFGKSFVALTLRTLFLFSATFIVALPSFAHHSVTMFDRTRTLVLSGEIKEFQWTNPHSWIQLFVKDETGNTVEWSLEGGSPGIMSRNGWKRTSLVPGEKVTIEFYPLNTGEPGGCFVEITKSDGTKLYYHG